MYALALASSQVYFQAHLLAVILCPGLKQAPPLRAALGRVSGLLTEALPVAAPEEYSLEWCAITLVKGWLNLSKDNTIASPQLQPLLNEEKAPCSSYDTVSGQSPEPG